MPDLAWLDGRFLPLARAKVPAMDRGFLFGDAVYEVIHATAGRPFLLAEHLRRLRASAGMLEIRLPGMGLFRRAIDVLLRRAGYREAVVYLQVSRGVSLPRKHAYPPRSTPPTVFAAVWKSSPEPEESYARGVRCITIEDFRWGRCDIKTVNLLANCMGRELARRSGAVEVIFVKDGFLVEGGASAVFAAKRGKLLVPPLSPRVLPSLTRELVLAIARRKRVPVAVRRVSVRELFAADEVFLASTSAEAMPVVRIDGRKVGTGRPGPVAALFHREILGRRQA